jgi:hypothetical protein
MDAPTNTNRRCATNPLNREFSLCGDAFDAFASGHADEEFEFAKVGEPITCEKCCHAVSEIKKLRNPLKPRIPYGAGQ